MIYWKKDVNSNNKKGIAYIEYDGHPQTLMNANKDGIIYELTEHALERMESRGVSNNAILDAINNPLQVKPVKLDNLNRPSQRIIGKEVEVVVNPDSNKIISVNPTSSRKAQNLINNQNE